VLLFLFWFFVAPAALMALYSVRTGKRYLEHVEGALKNPPAEFTPPVSLIVPVKGLDYGLASNLRSLAHQDYPDFELLIACASASDEALRVARASLDPSVRVITAGLPPSGTGEKVHNLLEAVRLARPESEVLAFADSDGHVSEGWLRALVAPLQEVDVGAATGFRWYFPEDGGFWPLLRSVWDSAIAGSMRDDDKNFAWGGGTAIRRATFDEARVPEFWQGAVSDDYRLTKAMNEALITFSENAFTLHASFPLLNKISTSTPAAVPAPGSKILELKSINFIWSTSGKRDLRDFFKTFASASTGPTPVSASCISLPLARSMMVASGRMPLSIKR